ncbi:pyridoxal phosphate-dependent aminotransferase [Celerinatantimonas sp. MCCC 1A17872]|uniref:pyridoxal phosphate-dependent aminotransferase n=1 Tax=Celerinatantimonas sp. MCCC 1A17872 TaxID=3177514 RepID=UPI0038BF440C
MGFIADRIANVPVSASVAMTEKARLMRAEGIDMVALSTGEPDFATPAHAIEAAHIAALAGDTHYPPTDGKPELKKAIQAKLLRDNHLDYELDEITTAGGAKQVIFNTMMATLNVGDEVLIPTPSWISYADIVRSAGGTPVPLPCFEEAGFIVQPADIRASISEKTKWLFLNFPNNPTGALANAQELSAIAQVLADFPNVWVLSDDIYEYLVYDDEKFLTLAQVAPALKSRTLIVNGVSKAYAMTGWRLGYCAGPKALISAINVINSQNGSGVATLSQAAAVAALNGPMDWVEKCIATYQQRRDYVLSRLQQIEGVHCITPKGAFYLFIHIGAYIGRTSAGGRLLDSDSAFVMALMQEQHVTSVAGSAYQMSPYMRISYATSLASLEKGCERLEAFCKGCN